MQRSQGSHLAKAFVHRAGCIQQDSFLSITFLISDVLHCMFEFLISLLQNYKLLILTKLGCQECSKTKLENEQLRWYVSPHSFCEAFLKGYSFFPEEMPGQAWSQQQVTQVRSLCGRWGDLKPQSNCWVRRWELSHILQECFCFHLAFFFRKQSHTRFLPFPNKREMHAIFKKERN